MLYDAIKKLVQYGINTGITPESERIYTTNLLLDLFHEDNYEDVDCDLNNLVQDFAFPAAAIALGSFSGLERLIVMSRVPYFVSTVHLRSLAIRYLRI